MAPDPTAFSDALLDLETRARDLEQRYEDVFRQAGIALLTAMMAAKTTVEGVQRVHDLGDRMLAELLSSRFNSQSTDCRTGCASCCHLVVKSPPQVVLSLAAEIKTHWSEAAIAGLLAELERHAENPAPYPPCPLLDTDHRCRAYAARPLSCRAFSSPDAGLCRALIAAQGRTAADIPQHVLIYRFYQTVTTVFEAAATKQGRDSRQVLLAPALHRALTNPDLEQKWAVGEPFLP